MAYFAVNEGVAEAELAHAPADRLEPRRPPWREQATATAAISAGAALGANLRYWAGNWSVERWGAGFPWGTLLVNVSGSLMIGFYLTLITERFTGRSTTRLFVATGFLGAYTTFSAFSYDTIHLIQQGETFRAILYAGSSLLAGMIAYFAGLLVAHAL